MIGSTRRFRLALLLACFAVLSVSAKAQKKAKPTSDSGQAILWQRVNIGSQDLFYGPGGREMQPDLRNITLIREEKGGYSKKYRIKDGAGKTWVAKIGLEAQSETASVRLLSALGYKTEINYLIPRLTIPGIGAFSNVRLEARPDDVDRGKEWQWNDNPFVGTEELQGLKIMMAFLNNWDMKNANNVILKTGGQKQYAISDLGVSFGKTGISGFPLLRWIGRTRNKPNDYAKSQFVTGVKNGRLKIKYNGKNYQLLRKISVAEARWLADLLTQLSDKQVRDAFRAANYSRNEIDLLTRAVKTRITQLDRAATDSRIAGDR